MVERAIWIRLGGYISGTKEEINNLMENGTGLKELLAKNQFEPYGESYIPSCEIESYNEEYGTDFEEEDTDIDPNT